MCAPFDLSIEPLEQVSRPDAALMTSRKAENRPSFREIGFHPVSQARSLGCVLLDGFSQPGFCGGSIGSGKDGADIVSHFAQHALSRYVSLRILLQMELAALPGNAAENGLTCGSQTGMGIADNQSHALEPTLYQALQEGSPVHFLFT